MLRTKRSLALLAALLIAVALLGRLAESIVGSRWAASSLVQEQELTAAVQTAFVGFQNETLREFQSSFPTDTLRLAIAELSDSTPLALFQLLASSAPGNLSVEVFSSAKHILAWTGPQGPVTDTALITDTLTSFVAQGPIYSYLVIAVPICPKGQEVGYAVVKRLFDVNYPISNRFITNNAFQGTFPTMLQLGVTFDCSGDSKPSGDSTLLSIPLPSLQGGREGYAYIQRPQLAARREELRNLLGTTEAVLFSIGAVWLVVIAFRWLGAVRSPFIRGCAQTALIWGLRYAFLFLAVPSRVLMTDFFDPKYFASPFGAGAAGTLGEMLITAVALFLNVLLLTRLALPILLSSPTSAGGGVRRVLRAVAVIIPSVTFLLLALRGFAALIHSAVFDSALPYNDPTSVLPSVPMAIMLVTLFLASLSLVLAGGMLVIVVCREMFRAVPRLREGVGNYTLSLAVIATGSFFFGIVQEHPLLGQLGRMMCAGLVFGAALWAWRILLRGGVGSLLRAGWIVAGVSVLLLVPLLDDKVHELDRAHVELLGSEIVRPEDSWLTFVVNKALDELSTPGVAALLESPDTTDLEKLAFTQWARSILSSEGNNCSVTYTRPDGSVLSDFHLGVPPHRKWEHRVEPPPIRRSVETEEKSQNGETVKWYTGSLPISGEDGSVVGVVWVELTGNRQSLLRGEAPDILRSGSKDEFRSRHRTLVLSEYYHGKLVATSNERIPLDRPLPAEVLRSAPAGMWMREEIEGTSYETYFLHDPKGGTDACIALSLESLDVRWHLYTFLRYVLFYGSMLLAALLVLLIIGRFQGHSVRPTVRVKLLGAFIIVSVIPVIILAYNNRQYAVERALASTEQALSAQTEQVASEIQRQLGMNLPVALRGLSDEQCVEIASDLNTDFNVYAGTALQASSKPEMFSAELLDTRLTAQCCINLLFKKKAFYAEKQSIGLLPYIVGYRSIAAENGSLIGVVSVPTLYRQTDIDEELTRRNVFLYGAYAVALLFSVVAGTVFAGQLSAPIRRLKQATQRIAEGNLQVDLEEGGHDELGELEQVFKNMTRDLRRAQERMMRTERELAWREMAKQVAHEIKNPLTPIKLSIQHLRQAYSDGVSDFGAILRNVTTTVLEQIEALTRIASEFSSFARMPAPLLSPCDAHKVVEEATALFQQHAGVTVRLSLAATASVVRADRDDLRRAFINILRNAVQAMDEHGLLTITSVNEEGALLLRFTDNGPGIAEEAKQHLFEPSFSTKTDGMGLGLALVKKTITDIGGEITITSTAGAGTTVAIRLPLEPEPVA